jgi:integrase
MVRPVEMSKLVLKSSITEPALKQFLSRAKEGQELFCERIAGFSIRKNRAAGSGSYQYRISSAQMARRRFVVGKTNSMKIKDAIAIALKIMDAVNEGEDLDGIACKYIPGKIKKRSPVNDLALLGNFFNEIYIPMRLRESGDSAKSPINMIKKHWGHLFDLPMNKIRPGHVQQWQDEMEKTNYKYKTIESTYGLLRSMLTRAVKLSHEQGHPCYGLLDESPFKVRPLRKASKQQKERELAKIREYENETRRIIESDELKTIEQGLYDHAQECIAQRERSRKHSNKRHLPSLLGQIFPHWIAPFVYLAYYTGMRPGDISTLRWEDIQHGKIRKVTNKSKYQTNPTTIALDIVDVKNVMNYSCKEVLDIWRSQMGNPMTGWVFPQVRNTDHPLSEKGYKKSWDQVKKLAGVNLDMYAFRHHFISTHIRMGTNLKLIATLAGHTTTEMIEKHYAHHFPSDIRAALSIM